MFGGETKPKRARACDVTVDLRGHNQDHNHQAQGPRAAGLSERPIERSEQVHSPVARVQLRIKIGLLLAATPVDPAAQQEWSDGRRPPERSGI